MTVRLKRKCRANHSDDVFRLNACIADWRPIMWPRANLPSSSDGWLVLGQWILIICKRRQQDGSSVAAREERHLSVITPTHADAHTHDTTSHLVSNCLHPFPFRRPTTSVGLCQWHCSRHTTRRTVTKRGFGIRKTNFWHYCTIQQKKNRTTGKGGNVTSAGWQVTSEVFVNYNDN